MIEQKIITEIQETVENHFAKTDYKDIEVFKRSLGAMLEHAEQGQWELVEPMLMILLKGLASTKGHH